MPPKAAAAAKASAPKKTKTEPAHGTYQDMIKDAIIQLKDRSGSSRQALKKYVLANNKLGNLSDAAFTQRFNQALSKGSESGAFIRPKGASGPVKLGKGKVEDEEKKPSAPKAAAKPKAAATTTTTKKATTTKTAAAPKKAAPATKKAAATTTTTTKKTAAKPKANTSKPRKTAPAAPAVEDKAPVVLGKTKSGRVTKSKAPAAAKKSAPAKKAAPKKAVAKK